MRELLDLGKSSERTLLIAARLDRLPATRVIWKFVVLLSFGFFFELYDMLYSGYIAPGLIRGGLLVKATPSLFDLHGVAGFIAVLFAGLFVGTLACGFLADRYGRRTIFTYSLLLYTAANLVMAFQTSVFGLNLWRFVAGLGIGVELVTIGTYISELVPKHIRGRAFACEQAVGFVAAPVVALLAYLLVPLSFLGLDGWRWVVIIGAHGAIFIWFIRRALPESPRWLAEKGRFAEAERLVTRIENQVEAEYGRPLPPVVATSVVVTRRTLADLWQEPYNKRVLMMSIFNVFQTIGFYGFANWVPALLAKKGVPVTNSLLYSSIIAISAPFGPIVGLYLGDKLERKSVIVAAAFAMTICGLSFSLMSNVSVVISLGILITLASNMMSYSFHAYQTELFPTSIRTTAVGFVYSWSRLSAIFTSFFIAAILERFGTSGVFVFIAVAMLIVIAVIGLMGPRTRDLTLEAISS
jgi:MFS transporter, putative metabolite:H+ symporter